MAAWLMLFPWTRWCYESPTIMSWHAQKRVLSRCIRLHRPPALRSLLPHLSSAIFCWQPWKKRLLHIHQTAVKRGGLRKRRSSRLVPAIGLHWFQKHIGLVSWVFPLFSYHSSIVVKKNLNFWAKLTKSIFLCSHFSTECTLFHLFVPCALLMTKRHIHSKCVKTGPPVRQPSNPAEDSGYLWCIPLSETKRWIIKQSSCFP